MKFEKTKLKGIVKFSVALASVLFASFASASVVPSEDDLGYTLYDIVVNDVLNGPIGFVGGLGAIIFSASQFASNWKPALFGIIGGTAAMNADTIASSMGALI